MLRFRLTDSSECKNCNEPIEDIDHRFVTCPKALEVWNMIDDLYEELDLVRGAHTLPEVLGLNQQEAKTKLTINAEIMARINSQAGKEFDPKMIVRLATHTILNCEPLTGTEKEKISNFISTIT